MVNTYFLESEKLLIDENEVLRYMGMGGLKEFPEEILVLVKKGILELKEKMNLKACYEKYPVSLNGDEVNLGFTTLNSLSLAKNLKNCREAIVFAATIGIDTDRILGKYSIISPSYANTLQAVGTAAIESFCDILMEYLSRKEGELCPRFSPGYGDLKLDVQNDILNKLESRKNIGLHITDSLIMIPSKSVSAIVGIKE